MNIRTLVQQALKTGRLVRPKCCEDCGGEARLEAHHEDYTKPLEVRWLCRPCHGRADAKRRAEGRPSSAASITFSRRERERLERLCGLLGVGYTRAMTMAATHMLVTIERRERVHYVVPSELNAEGNGP